MLVVTPTRVREPDPRAALWPHLSPLEVLRSSGERSRRQLLTQSTSKPELLVASEALLR